VAVAELDAVRPPFVLVHAKNGDDAPVLGSSYELRRDRRFGSERYLALWARVPKVTEVPGPETRHSPFVHGD
jgi:hypothetical protein